MTRALAAGRIAVLRAFACAITIALAPTAAAAGEIPSSSAHAGAATTIALGDTCTDLRVTGFSFADGPSVFPAQVIGGALSVTITIQNLTGGIIAPGAALYVSSDSVITRFDRQLIGGRMALDYDVPPDSSVELRLRVPTGVAVPQFQVGPAYLGVIVDDFNAVEECDETNNTGAIPVTIVPASEAVTLPSFTESWTSGIDFNQWLVYGEPEPKATTNAICDSVSSVDPKGDGLCYSGLWMKEPVAWRLGSRLSVRFATNVTGARRSPNGQSLRFGLCGGWDPLPPCEGAFGPVIPRLWTSVNMATAGDEIITFLADGVGEIAAALPYTVAMDTTCHTLVFLNTTDGRIRVELDGVAIGTSADVIALPDPLFLFVDGQSADITNVVSEIELAPGIVSPTVLVFPTTHAGDVESLPLGISNPDTLPLPIDAIDLGAGPFSLVPAFAESLEAGLEVPPGARLETQVLFAPLDGANYDTRAVLWSGGDTLTTLPILGKSIGLDFSWNNPEDYDPREITEGERVRIKAQLGDDVEVDSVILHYSKGDMRDFLSVPMTLIDDPFSDRDRYQGVIPGEMSDASGLEFYISAHNGAAAEKFRSAESPELLRVRVASLNFERLPPPETYAMISLPLEVPNTPLMSFLIDDLGDPSLWRMFAYDRRAGAYEEIHADSEYPVRQSEAYWLIKRGPLALDGPDPIDGLSTPLDSAFTISLSPGWNMISNPFAMSVAWDSCRIDGVPTPVAEAAGTVSALIPWDWSQSAYLDSTDILWPFEGYWVRNETPALVTLSVPPIPEGTISTERAKARDAGGSAKSDGTGASAPPGEWRLRIIASAAGSHDRINVIGSSAGAGEQWDRLDRFEPPLGPGEAIGLYFPHDDWGARAGRYTADIRPDRAPMEWAFDVARTTSADPSGGLVTLEFSGLETLPVDLDLVLTDRALGREIDLRLTDAYSFVCGAREPVSSERDCRFALRAVRRLGDAQDRAPASDRLFANIPNPFNPATVIHYDVAEAGEVRLRIFDAAGRLVRALFTGSPAPGRYQAVWDGKDDRGGDAPSGIYICRMERGPVTSSVRMVLLR